MYSSMLAPVIHLVSCSFFSFMIKLIFPVKDITIIIIFIIHPNHHPLSLLSFAFTWDPKHKTFACWLVNEPFTDTNSWKLLKRVSWGLVFRKIIKCWVQYSTSLLWQCFLGNAEVYISYFTFHVHSHFLKLRCKFKHHECCEIQLPLIYGTTHLTLRQTLLKVLHGLFLLSCWLLAVLGNHQWAPNEELDLCQLMNGLWMLWISALKDLSLQEQSLWSGWHLGRSSSSPPHTLTRT